MIGNKFLNVFILTVKENFEEFLKANGFELEDSRLEKYNCEVIFRRKKQYIRIEANIHPQDKPEYWNIMLGEGETADPESDWNSVALWHLKKYFEPERESKEYFLKNNSIKQLPGIIEDAKNDLRKYGSLFLRGDLNLFYKIRSDINKTREPYKSYDMDYDGNCTESYDEESVRLKERFSQLNDEDS